MDLEKFFALSFFITLPLAFLETTSLVRSPFGQESFSLIAFWFFISYIITKFIVWIKNRKK